MNIYTVTFLSSNYGSTLQAYALQQRLKENGVDAYVINEHKEPPRHPRLQSLLYVLKPRKHYNLYQRLKLQLDKRKYLAKNAKLTSFIKTNISTLEISDRGGFLKSIHTGDIFLAGSDQIWCTMDYPLSEWFSLQWVDNRFKKYSYAVSIGQSLLTKEQINSYKRGLSEFQQISFREIQAVNLLKDSFNNIRQDLDPTLLYDGTFWGKIASSRILKQPYVFVYMLRPDPNVIQLARKVAKEQNCKIVYTGLSADKMDDIITVTDAGVEDFLSYIYHAEAIITNSFHGTVFSVLFEKPFLSVKLASTSSRVENLLGMIGMMDQLVTDVNKEYKLSLDYSEVRKILEEKRKASLDYIKMICS